MSPELLHRREGLGVMVGSTHGPAWQTWGRIWPLSLQTSCPPNLRKARRQDAWVSHSGWGQEPSSGDVTR